MKYLTDTKTCNTCGNKHEHIPSRYDDAKANPRRDVSYDGWHWDCKCGSTMFSPTSKIDWSTQCKCDECRDNLEVNECEFDCQCMGCNEKQHEQFEYNKDCRDDR